LARGQSGRVLRVGGRPAARRRLLELGVVRGEIITLQRAAPLGDPLEFVVKGYHLSLRAREAATITVEAMAAPVGERRSVGDDPDGDDPDAAEAPSETIVKAAVAA
jgi:Fe2+ transport system protein FeoA